MKLHFGEAKEKNYDTTGIKMMPAQIVQRVQSQNNHHMLERESFTVKKYEPRYEPRYEPKYEPRYELRSQPEIIPRTVFQTFHTKQLPIEISRIRDNLIKNNPGFSYRLSDDNDCRQFIKDNFDDEVLWAFDILRPGAYKADLWRYCVMFKIGGIYLDIKLD